MVNDRTLLALGALRAAAPADWVVSDTAIGYPEALAAMEARAAAVADGTAPECVWLLTHPPLYTAGTSAGASAGGVAADQRFPLYATGRGGQMTYHGPGQRVAYLMLDLRRRGSDLRLFVAGLEEWLIRTLAAFNIRGERREDRVGVWVRRPEQGLRREDKIAAIGIRVRRWVTLHGISLNVDPDLSHFAGIVPCGVNDPDFGVTSLVDLGLPVTMPEADAALCAAFREVFGSVRKVAGPLPLPVSAPAGAATAPCGD